MEERLILEILKVSLLHFSFRNVTLSAKRVFNQRQKCNILLLENITEQAISIF